jgi:UrcA family protein
MKASKMYKCVAMTIAVAGLSAPALASTEVAFESRMEKVAYADLNVDRQRGAEILYQRLQQASKRVCGVESIRTVRGARREAEQRNCYRLTLDQAVAEVDSDALNAVHEG